MAPVLAPLPVVVRVAVLVLVLVLVLVQAPVRPPRVRPPRVPQLLLDWWLLLWPQLPWLLLRFPRKMMQLLLPHLVLHRQHQPQNNRINFIKRPRGGVFLCGKLWLG